MVSEASFKARAAFCSPSAAITWSEKTARHDDRGATVNMTIYKPWPSPHGQLRLLLPWLSAVVWGADSLC